MRILVVDHDKNLADTLAELILNALGREAVVDVAYDGESGLRLALENPPDAVVMDLDMPAMSGEDSALLIRAALSDRVQPVIVAVTGGLLRRSGDCCIFDRVLLKPVEIARLVEVLFLCGLKAGPKWADGRSTINHCQQ